MGSRGWRGATSLLERAGVGFVDVDMWWAGRAMGLTALLVGVRESFEKERSWFVDIVCGLNDRKVKLKWEAETVMGERSKMRSRSGACASLRQVGYASHLKRQWQEEPNLQC